MPIRYNTFNKRAIKKDNTNKRSVFAVHLSGVFLVKVFHAFCKF